MDMIEYIGTGLKGKELTKFLTETFIEGNNPEMLRVKDLVPRELYELCLLYEAAYIEVTQTETSRIDKLEEKVATMSDLIAEMRKVKESKTLAQEVSDYEDRMDNEQSKERITRAPLNIRHIWAGCGAFYDECKCILGNKRDVQKS